MYDYLFGASRPGGEFRYRCLFDVLKMIHQTVWEAIAPHSGGTWEREVKSIKTALWVVLKDQTVPEPVLQKMLAKVEGIMNAKLVVQRNRPITGHPISPPYGVA